MQFVFIPDDYRDNLGKQVLDYEEYDTSKKRYYYYKIEITSSHFALIPLRKNCSSSADCLPIYNPESINHGFDFQKMIIMDKSHILFSTSIDMKVYQDVQNKEHLLSKRVFENINKYKALRIKQNERKFLSEQEIRFINFSTLQYFETIIWAIT